MCAHPDHVVEPKAQSKLDEIFWLNGRRIQQVQRDLGTAIAERDAARAELAPLKKALELALARLNGIDL